MLQSENIFYFLVVADERALSLVEVAVLSNESENLTYVCEVENGCSSGCESDQTVWPGKCLLARKHYSSCIIVSELSGVRIRGCIIVRNYGMCSAG